MKVLAESNWDYILEEDHEYNLYFEVVCGTVAIYTIKFILNDIEREIWYKEGTTGLRHLAYDVRDYPDRYLCRKM